MESMLITAFALMLIFEGIMPFVAPKVWREVFRRMVEMNDGQLRFVGITSILIGVGIFTLTRFL